MDDHNPAVKYCMHGYVNMCKITMNTVFDHTTASIYSMNVQEMFLQIFHRHGQNGFTTKQLLMYSQPPYSNQI